MNTMRLLAVPFIAAGIICVTSAIGQSNPQRNAATWYMRAFEHLDRLTGDELTLLSEYDPAKHGAPSQELRIVLDRIQPMIRLTERGSMQREADFPLDRSEGIMMLLPHVSHMRWLAQAMRADALVRLHDGESRVAAERIAATYRMSSHLRADQITISALVGQSMFMIAESAIQVAVDHAAIDPHAARILFQTIDSFDPNDPFNFLGAMIGEQDMVVSWLESIEENIADGLNEMLLFDNGDVPPIFQDYTTEQFRADVEQYDLMMDQVVDAFAMRDHDAARQIMDELIDDVVAGEHGPLATLITPAFGRVMERRNQGSAALNARRESLLKIAGGEVGPAEFANAATWYLRGIARLENLTDRQRFILRSFDAANESLDAALLEAIIPAIPAMDVFRQGAAVERCDFSIASSERAAHFMPRYVPGMRDALRLLHADARRLLANSEAERAVSRLATSARIIAHLSNDPQMLSAIVSHAAFGELMQIIRFALEHEHLDDEQRAHLAAAIERIDRTDPFGYLAARRRIVDEWPGQMRRLRTIAFRSAPEGEADERRVTIEQVADFNASLAERSDETTLFYFHAADSALHHALNRDLEAVIDSIERDLPDEDADGGDGVVTGADQLDEVRHLPVVTRHALDDVLDLEQWLIVLLDAEVWQEQLERGEMTDFGKLAIVPLNMHAARRASARRDLRDAMTLLRPATVAENIDARDREATDPPFATPSTAGPASESEPD